MVLYTDASCKSGVCWVAVVVYQDDQVVFEMAERLETSVGSTIAEYLAIGAAVALAHARGWQQATILNDEATAVAWARGEKRIRARHQLADDRERLNDLLGGIVESPSARLRARRIAHILSLARLCAYNVMRTSRVDGAMVEGRGNLVFSPFGVSLRNIRAGKRISLGLPTPESCFRYQARF